MAQPTHCLPTGSLAANEIPVCRVYGPDISVTAPSGNYRGVIVWLGGLNQFTPVFPTIAWLGFSTFLNDLQSDNWMQIYPPIPEFFIGTNPALNDYNSVSSDANHGTLYVNSFLHWWDHLVLYINQTYGLGVPIIPFGISWGGMQALLIAANRTSTIASYMAQVPAILQDTLSPTDTVSSGVSFGSILWSGANVGATALNSVILPGIIGYATNDVILGWTGTTVAAGSSGVDVTTFAGAGVLDVASSANITVGPCVIVPTSSGTATIEFTGTGTGTLTGCTTLRGTGTLTTGAAVTQNNVAALIAAQQAAQPSHQVSTYVSTNGHNFNTADQTDFFSNFVQPVLDPLFPAVF